MTLLDFHMVLPEVFLALSTLLLLMIGVFQQDNKGTTATLSSLSIIVLLVCVGLIISSSRLTGYGFDKLFINDGFSIFLKVLILLATAVAIVYAKIDFMGQKAWRFELPVVILLAALGMMVMVSASNFMTLYLGLELQSLALYVLAAFKRDTEKSSEAGLKYFVLGALASGLLLFGISLIYGYTGSVDFSVLTSTFAVEKSPIAILGLVFVLAGLSFKISAVPFHMWTPDVYEGAPTAVTAFFAMAPKIAAVGLLLRVLIGPMIGLIAEWQQVIFFVSAASMIVGAFAGLRQENIKRLLAYSSIGHIGYALMGLAAGNLAAISSLLFYMVMYMIMTIGAFGVIIYLRNQNRSLERVDDLAGLSKDQPVIALIMALIMFSMAGIPPLAGFIAKFVVFKSVIDIGFYWLAIIGVLTSVVSAYYYLRVIKTMYFDTATSGIEVVRSTSMRAILVFCAVALVMFTIDPSFIFSQTEIAAVSLFLSGQ